MSSTLGATGELTSVRTRSKGRDDAETLDTVWAIITQEHDRDIHELKAGLKQEQHMREEAERRVDARREEAMQELRSLIHDISGAHHLRRILFAALILVGLVLVTIGGTLAAGPSASGPTR